MAEHAEGEGNIFVYLGGQQEVPAGVTRVRIDRSVKIIPREAFDKRKYLVSVETHDGIEMIEEYAFDGCISLGGIKLPGVREVGYGAFAYCTSLTDVEFGDKLETLGEQAFSGCQSMRNIKMPSVRTIGERIGSRAFFECKSLRSITMPTVRTIGRAAFGGCEQLTVAEFGNNLERIGDIAFYRCPRLRRIAIPLKDNMFTFDTNTMRYDQFDWCDNLTTVDLVGMEKIHNTISSLLMESWRNEMNREIDLINQVLPTAHAHEKTDAIRLWIRSVINRMEHYKAEHYALVKEDMTQLELAVWKAKLEEDEEDDSNLKVQAKKAMIDMENARKERRITCGADINIIISNVLPFLQLLE